MVLSEDVVVIRRARASDAAARAAVIREAYHSLNLDAFIYFFFNEATLQGVVLIGAALFIFCGAGLGALCALPAGAALAAAAGAAAAHASAAGRAAARMTREEAGWVAERRGPLRAPGAPPPNNFKLVVDLDAAPVPGGQVVGTVSLDSCCDAAGGWLTALCVSLAWRRRGLGRALEAAARAHRRRALHALVSALQPAARALMHAAGWRVGGGYARPLLGAALTLPLTRLQHDGDAP